MDQRAATRSKVEGRGRHGGGSWRYGCCRLVANAVETSASELLRDNLTVVHSRNNTPLPLPASLVFAAPDTLLLLAAAASIQSQANSFVVHTKKLCGKERLVTTSMSLFGSNSQGGTGGGGLFGSSTTQASNTGGGGGGLFGSNTNQQGGSAGVGLFGSHANQQSGNTGGSLFGANATQQNGNAGGGWFGSSTQQNQQNPAVGTTGGLFGGGSTNQSGGGRGLFGTNTAPNQQATASASIFGSNTNQQRSGTSSLFGDGQNATNTQQQNTGSSLGGGSSMFGGQNQQPQNSMSGGGLTTPNSQGQQQQQTSSIFNPQVVSVGNFGHTMTAAQLQRLQYSGLATAPNEKRVAEQIKTVAEKWNPDNPPNTPVTTVLKTYLYNAVPKEYAPFFYPNTEQGEDDKSWEEALSQKPEPPKVDGQEVSTLAYVPILCKGFKALGDRVETQAKIIQEMRARLHEMNNSLSAVMDAHQQRITVKIASTKRQHQVLSQRCLRLAVKVQVLRNRGFALDAAEENLRKTLISLEKQAMDPGFVGREDEIWARLVALRERARWLEEEGKRVSAQLDEQNRQGIGADGRSGVPEDVLVKTRKILKDYDNQLAHLNRELDDVKKEFREWEEMQRRR